MASAEVARGAAFPLCAMALLACTPQPKASARVATVTESPHAREIPIRGGTLVRGRADGRRDESPRHEVVVSDFFIDETLVTRRAFDAFVAATHHVTTAERNGFGMGASEGMADWAWERIPGASYKRPYWEETPDHASFQRPDAPVVMVSYDDAVAYCAFLGRRLPTEAQWEHAMRAGSADTRYPWGDDPKRDGVYALNFWQGDSHVHNDRLDGWVYVSPVKAFRPNASGLYDPVGNVWQWTRDWYSVATFAETASRAAQGVVRDPEGPQTGALRVLRGGSWWCGACTCEGNGLSYRGKSLPSAPYNNIGFRCAR